MTISVKSDDDRQSLTKVFFNVPTNQLFQVTDVIKPSEVTETPTKYYVNYLVVPINNELPILRLKMSTEVAAEKFWFNFNCTEMAFFLQRKGELVSAVYDSSQTPLQPFSWPFESDKPEKCVGIFMNRKTWNVSTFQRFTRAAHRYRRLINWRHGKAIERNKVYLRYSYRLSVVWGCLRATSNMLSGIFIVFVVKHEVRNVYPSSLRHQ